VKRSSPVTNALPLRALAESGLLWLFNATTLHPRGFEVHLVVSGDDVVGWQLLGDGTVPWAFDQAVDGEAFRTASDFLEQHTKQPPAPR